MPLEEASLKAEAFDGWYTSQPADVRDTVDAHILTLMRTIPGHFGVQSAKLLLAEVYLLVRRKVKIENKYGVRYE